MNIYVYEVIELLVRLAAYNDKIGDYEVHHVVENVMHVLTSTGSLVIPLEIAILHVHSPGELTEANLKRVALSLQQSEFFPR